MEIFTAMGHTDGQTPNQLHFHNQAQVWRTHHLNYQETGTLKLPLMSIEWLTVTVPSSKPWRVSCVKHYTAKHWTKPAETTDHATFGQFNTPTSGRTSQLGHRLKQMWYIGLRARTAPLIVFLLDHRQSHITLSDHPLSPSPGPHTVPSLSDHPLSMVWYCKV